MDVDPIIISLGAALVALFITEGVRRAVRREELRRTRERLDELEHHHWLVTFGDEKEREYKHSDWDEVDEADKGRVTHHEWLEEDGEEEPSRAEPRADAEAVEAATVGEARERDTQRQPLGQRLVDALFEQPRVVIGNTVALVILVIALVVILSDSYDDDTRNWAFGIAGGAFGYLCKQ